MFNELRKKQFCVFFLLFAILLGLPGCAKNNPGKEEIVAYVNKEPIYLSELQRETRPLPSPLKQNTTSSPYSLTVS
jgi:hypothetical protein